mgnify:CR=1 FL=1
MTKLFEDIEDEVEVSIPEDDPLKPFLEKYKDPLGVAKSLVEKDRFIRQLQRENGEVRADLASRISVEEKVDRLLQGTPVVPNTPVATSVASQQNESNTSLTTEDVEKLLRKREQETVSGQNLLNTRLELAKLYGPDWSKVVQAKMKELGESVEYMTELAKSRPQVLLRLLGDAPVVNTQPVFRGENTTSKSLGVGNTQQRTMSYYNKIKAQDPAKYWSPAIQNQLHKDSLSLREAFFDV